MSWFFILLIFSFFACNFSWRVRHTKEKWYGRLGEPYTNITDLPKEQYFDQKLDHFSPSNGQTWKQRYFVNDSFYQQGGPAFLMIGGEGEASAKWLVEGTWIKYAEKYKAYCILLEHRFYGKSHPTDDLSVKNLAYLSSEQALADLAYFIVSFNDMMHWDLPPRWILFGGSYPGSLAAWMRLKYPHLVHGSVSTSGPLVALPDFKDYFGVVKESLELYNPNCVTAIKKSQEQLSLFLSHPLGQKSVSKLFKLCDELELNNQNDFSNLYESLAGNFAEVVQYNKDNRHTEDGIILTIDLVCDVMMNKTLGDEIHRLAEVNSLVLQKSKERCLDFKYDKMLKQMRVTDWDSDAAKGGRQWLYQTCTEFGFFQTSSLNSTKEMFGDKFPLEFFVKQCSDIYGIKFNLALLKEGIKRTNMIYGGMDDRADNIVYVHGSVDPWHVLGITKTLRNGTMAIYIEGTAHCANMYPSSPNDPPQLIQAREEIGFLIGQWLAQEYL